MHDVLDFNSTEVREDLGALPSLYGPYSAAQFEAIFQVINVRRVGFERTLAQVYLMRSSATKQIAWLVRICGYS